MQEDKDQFSQNLDPEVEAGARVIEGKDWYSRNFLFITFSH